MKKLITIIAIALIISACRDKNENNLSEEIKSSELSGTIKVDGSSN